MTLSTVEGHGVICVACSWVGWEVDLDSVAVAGGPRVAVARISGPSRGTWVETSDHRSWEVEGRIGCRDGFSVSVPTDGLYWPLYMCFVAESCYRS